VLGTTLGMMLANIPAVFVVLGILTIVGIGG